MGCFKSKPRESLRYYRVIDNLAFEDEQGDASKKFKQQAQLQQSLLPQQPTARVQPPKPRRRSRTHTGST